MRPRTAARHRTLPRAGAAGLALATAAALSLAGCSDTGTAADGTVEITLAGPNQWNSDSSSFGKDWNEMIAAFEKDEPHIRIKTDVLPLADFGKTLSTQLSAGTAPELVFNQAPHEPYMVHPLDAELRKPNPFARGNKHWIDLFDPKYFGPGKGVNAQGKTEFIPFNTVSTGLFYNKEAFAKAGVTAPVTTFDGLLTACGKLKSAGYTPLAMDSSPLGIGWTIKTISNMLLDKYYAPLNVYGADGKKGTAPQLTSKAWARAVLGGKIDATRTPEVAESVTLLKQVFDRCATKNWSGISASSAAVVNDRDFNSGKAAMAWGTPFGYASLGAMARKTASMPFPTITKKTTGLSSNAPARFGASVGGTNYMIPSTVKGAKYRAALTFLQWMSIPSHVQKWLNRTGALPALRGATAPASTKAMAQGVWSEQMRTGGQPDAPKGVTVNSLYDGYLLGSKTLPATLKNLEKSWRSLEQQNVKDFGWGREPWAKG